MIYLSSFSHSVEILDLPVINFNDNIFEKNTKDNKKEKWEIYSDITKSIMCDAGKFKKSDKSYKENLKYSELLRLRNEKDMNKQF